MIKVESTRVTTPNAPVAKKSHHDSYAGTIPLTIVESMIASLVLLFSHCHGSLQLV